MTSRRAALAIAAVTAVHLAPVVLLRPFPTQDGPSHAAAAAVLARGNPLYDADWSPLPNVAVHWVLALVMKAGVPGDIAHAVLAGALVLALPASLAYALDGNRWLAIAALPLGAGWFLWMGFDNFLWGVVAMLFTIGWWRRAGHPVVTALLLVVTALCHVVAVVAALAFLALRARGRVRELVLAALPAVVLVALTASSGDGAARWTPAPTVARRALSLAYPVRTFSEREEWGGIAVAIALAVAAAGRRRRGDRAAVPWLVAAGGAFTAALVLPSAVGEASFVPDRLTVIAALAFVLWVGAGEVPRWAQRAAFGTLAVASIALAAMRLPTAFDVDERAAEYLALARRVPDGRTLLPVLVADEDDDGRSPRPLAHLAGWRTVEGDVVDLSHYEATLPYFPARFRDPYDPADNALFRGPLQAVPPDIHVRDYESATAVTVDYVLVWGLPAPLPAGLAADLRDCYRPVATSATGRGRLWSSNGTCGTSDQSRSRS